MHASIPSRNPAGHQGQTESPADFVARGEAAIARWRREGGGLSVDEVMAELQERLDQVKRQAAPVSSHRGQVLPVA